MSCQFLAKIECVTFDFNSDFSECTDTNNEKYTQIAKIALDSNVVFYLVLKCRELVRICQLQSQTKIGSDLSI